MEVKLIYVFIIKSNFAGFSHKDIFLTLKKNAFSLTVASSKNCINGGGNAPHFSNSPECGGGLNGVNIQEITDLKLKVMISLQAEWLIETYPQKKPKSSLLKIVIINRLNVLTSIL